MDVAHGAGALARTDERILTSALFTEADTTYKLLGLAGLQLLLGLLGQQKFQFSLALLLGAGTRVTMLRKVTKLTALPSTAGQHVADRAM